MDEIISESNQIKSNQIKTNKRGDGEWGMQMELGYVWCLLYLIDCHKLDIVG